jgi:transcription termination/antitermination protein NusA
MVTNFAITGNTEILQVAEAVAREKSIPKEAVINAMKEAVETAARKKYGHEQHVLANINQKTGEISIARIRTVVETVENAVAEISLADAKLKDASLELGSTIAEPLPPIDFGRVTSQTFKQVVIQKVREAEREKQYDDFKDRIGEIVTGVVKRIEYGNLIVDFGKTETILPRDQIIPREVFRQGDRIRAYIVDVRRDNKGQQIVLSRTHGSFLAQLFAQEVPEIYDGVVKIMAHGQNALLFQKIHPSIQLAPVLALVVHG